MVVQTVLLTRHEDNEQVEASHASSMVCKRFLQTLQAHVIHPFARAISWNSLVITQRAHHLFISSTTYGANSGKRYRAWHGGSGDYTDRTRASSQCSWREQSCTLLAGHFVVSQLCLTPIVKFGQGRLGVRQSTPVHPVPSVDIIAEPISYPDTFPLHLNFDETGHTTLYVHVAPSLRFPSTSELKGQLNLI